MPLLFENQKEALKDMKNGCILCGDVGSGKSMASLAYYMTSVCGGEYDDEDHYTPPKNCIPLVILTTAKKRDDKGWDKELERWGLSRDPANSYKGTEIIVDSWNNIKKYRKFYGYFFIFDEQRVVGRGAWVKAFWDIARKNKWILLSATPGDTWLDYFPVFKANGMYKTKGDFEWQHIEYDPYVTKYPKIRRFIHVDKLERNRKELLVVMRSEKPALAHHIDVDVMYDIANYNRVWKDNWNIYEDEPIQQSSERFYCALKVINSSKERIDEAKKLCELNPKVIIFYCYDYELFILRKICEDNKFPYSEWNGHKHENILDTDRWVYLAQYDSACEAWECIDTDTMVFYSQPYSYRKLHQAQGRINRRNTPFKHLYFYHLRSQAPLDKGITRALERKETFNEKIFLEELEDEETL